MKKPTTKTTTIHITEDHCPSCGKPESIAGGLCLACTTKRLHGGYHTPPAQDDGDGVRVNAGRAAVAWLNAFLASSDDEARGVLYRTLSVEVFSTGLQFIGCNGILLFRTWVASGGAPMPLLEEAPERAVVVMDREKFALGFIRTMLAAAKDQTAEPLTVAIEAAPEPTTAPTLGAAFNTQVLTLRAFGQRLHCPLYESEYVNWRGLQFGVPAAERVDGMKIAVNQFAAVGKLRGLQGIDCVFHGADRHIEIHGVGAEAEVRGLLMPMRRTTSTHTDGPDGSPEA